MDCSNYLFCARTETRTAVQRACSERGQIRVEKSWKFGKDTRYVTRPFLSSFAIHVLSEYGALPLRNRIASFQSRSLIGQSEEQKLPSFPNRERGPELHRFLDTQMRDTGQQVQSEMERHGCMGYLVVREFAKCPPLRQEQPC